MDAPKPNRNLSEISHLFLSSVRDRQTAGAARPKRMPPPAKPDVSVDLTPEEFAQVNAGMMADSGEPTVRIPPVTAIIASHLGKPSEQIKQYARHLAAAGKRIGIIEVDGSQFRLMCFEPAQHEGTSTSPEPQPIEQFDSRVMGDALDEMSWDLDRWLVFLPNPRTTEARNMLRTIEHWALLSTCDHDGVVACYRTLKGLSDLPAPKLSLSALDATAQEQADRVFQKLSSVCQQFLGWTVQMETPVQAAPATAEHMVMCCRPIHDKAQLANNNQWKVLAAFLAKAANQPMAQASVGALEQPAIDDGEHAAFTEQDQPTIPTIESPKAVTFGRQVAPEIPNPIPMPQSAIPAAALNLAMAQSSPEAIPLPPISRPAVPAGTLVEKSSTVNTMDEVLDLPDSHITESSILSAIIRHAQAGLIECPVHPPMCPEARLAVTRDRGLVMLAVARQGLTELRSIGQAYRWLVENRALIGMAVPQLSIDALQHPRLRLLVEHTDLSAEILQPMLEARTVTVQAYRKLRWGSKTGLLLEAA